MADRHTEEINQLFDRLRPGVMTPKPVVDTVMDGMNPVGWVKIDDAESQEIAAIGRQIHRPAPLTVAHNTWTKVTSFSSTPFTGVGTTYNAYGGSEIRVDVPGLFLIVVHAEFVAAAGGNRRIVGVSFNSGITPTAVPFETNWDSRKPTLEGEHINAAWVVPMNTNDTVALFVYQNSGGNVDLQDAVLNVIRMGT